MGISALINCDIANVKLGDMWKSSDGKDYARMMCSPRCRKLLEEYTGIDLGALLSEDRNAPEKVLETIDLLLTWLPQKRSEEWSEEEGERYGYLYAEISGEISDSKYFYGGWYLKDLRDLRRAVEKAKAAGASFVYFFLI